jgi:hypothetical protein
MGLLDCMINIKYIYPKTAGIDFFLFRLFGAGLGNLLFSWAIAVIKSKELSIPIIMPTFFNISPLQIIRGEFINRIYINPFKNSNYISGLKKFRILFSQYFKPRNSKIVDIIDAGVSDLEKILLNRDLIIKELFNILPDKIIDLYNLTDFNRISVHIRLGDFKIVHGAGILDSYINSLICLRNKYPSIPIHIYSDGKPDELIELTIFSNIKFMPCTSPIQDLINMSKAQYFIGTKNSTFSIWACIIGNHKFHLV